MNTIATAENGESFADTTVIERAAVARPRVFQPGQRQAAPRAAAVTRRVPMAAQKLPSSASSLLTLAVATLVVVPLAAMALVLARVGVLG